MDNRALSNRGQDKDFVGESGSRERILPVREGGVTSPPISHRIVRSPGDHRDRVCHKRQEHDTHPQKKEFKAVDTTTTYPTRRVPSSRHQASPRVKGSGSSSVVGKHSARTGTRTSLLKFEKTSVPAPYPGPTSTGVRRLLSKQTSQDPGSQTGTQADGRAGNPRKGTPHRNK